MNIELTRSAKRAIAKIFREYENRRFMKEPKKTAIEFDNIKYANLIAEINDDLPELRATKLIKQDILGNITLNDSAIIFMEELPAETIQKWLSFVASIVH